MKVRELKELLNNCDDDNDVVISINNPGGYVCPDGAYVDVLEVNNGFDWHMGLTEIIPQNRLNVDNIDNWSKRKTDFYKYK